MTQREKGDLEMPLIAAGWEAEEEDKLVNLVKPHPILYNVHDPSRNNMLARESTWKEIAAALKKPVEECKKRWRGLRDSYMRCKRMGATHSLKADVFMKLDFLDTDLYIESIVMEPDIETETIVGSNEDVITDNHEYYEITVENEEDSQEPEVKIIPEIVVSEPPKKNKRNAGRKRSVPMPRNIPPVKILPKPIVMNRPNILRYVEDTKTPEQRSQNIDKLIEKVLNENTNDIDVFFRSMAASVKKLQPSLVPKVKMEVCNVIAKYEMQSFERH